MVIANTNFYSVKELRIKPIKRLEGGSGWARHIVVEDKDGNEIDLCLFAPEQHNLKIKTVKK